jgi:hypothetical protein
MNLVRGLDDGSVFVGMFEGSTLLASSRAILLGPPCTARLEHGIMTEPEAGSGDTSGTWRVRATKPGRDDSSTATSLGLKQPATLSSVSVSGVGTTTATLNLTTNTGSGEFRYVVDLESHDAWWHGRRYDIAGFESTNGVYSGPTGASGTQAVPSTGAKTISITGLTTATTYHAYVVQVTNSGRTVSAVADLGSFTTS